MTLNFSVQGYATTMVVTQSDSTGQNFSATVTQNGTTTVIPMWFPSSLNTYQPTTALRHTDTLPSWICHWVIPILSIAGGSLGLFLTLAGPLGWAAEATITALTWLGVGFSGAALSADILEKLGC